MIGLLVLGLLVAPYTVPWEPAEAQAAGEPVIVFVSPPPGDELRYTRTEDPIDPAITVDVAVAFPIVETPCAGANPPVDTSTLEVYVVRWLDSEVLESWAVDTSSGWTWTATAPDRVEGQVTIGGPDSGQNRSRYSVSVCIRNAVGRKCGNGYFRVEFPVAEFTAAVYDARGTSFSQGGAGCALIPIPDVAIPLINQAMAATEFSVFVPSGAGMAGGAGTVSFDQIPLIGSIYMPASLNEVANEVDLAEASVSGIDLSWTGFPGTNCLISGKADGSLLGEVSPGQDLDGSLRVYDIQVGPGVGAGTCELLAAPTCEFNIWFDGKTPD
jgi:hypothetical protein